MPSLITSSQSCSVVGRNVQTLNIINRDIIEYARHRQARGWLSSLGQTQAFDKVERFFLYTLSSSERNLIYTSVNISLHTSPLTSLHGISVVDKAWILGMSHRASRAIRESSEEQMKALKLQINRVLEFKFPYSHTMYAVIYS
ncbi:hypothetical protein MRX96_057138 [Rhipicephalus microplus]